jgi:UDP-N-acetylglucosamine--N-acetylmuramyl-(pentapeptide) pyrophosphoryl-undecaprenol N-acetylglucosamine transferase
MTTLLIATTGGHLAQLADVAGRLPEDGDGERVWVTHENAQSRSLLAGESVEYLPYIGVRDVLGVLRTTRVAHRLLRERHLTRAVSTGSGIALSFLPYLAARGVSTHYIESAARVGGPSLSGRLMTGAPRVRLYTQYRRLATGRWHYGGAVFDGFRPLAPAAPAPVVRAVVTLGTAQEFPFRRLLDALVPLLGPGGKLEAEAGRPVDTLWQTGGTPVDGLPIEGRAWMAADELDAALAAADVVVTHAGTGSALAALRAGRCPVLVPRETAYGEVGDDHQAALAQELAERGLAVHRRVEELTADDLVAAAGRRVERVARPPTFELVP